MASVGARHVLMRVRVGNQIVTRDVVRAGLIQSWKKKGAHDTEQGKEGTHMSEHAARGGSGERERHGAPHVLLLIARVQCGSFLCAAVWKSVWRQNKVSSSVKPDSAGNARDQCSKRDLCPLVRRGASSSRSLGSSCHCASVSASAKMHADDGAAAVDVGVGSERGM